MFSNFSVSLRNATLCSWVSVQKKKKRYLWLKWRSCGPLHALWLLIHCIKQKCPLRPEKRNRNSHYTVIQLRCNLQTTNASSEIEELIFSLTFSSLLTSNYSSSAVWRRKFFFLSSAVLSNEMNPHVHMWAYWTGFKHLEDQSHANGPVRWKQQQLTTLLRREALVKLQTPGASSSDL